MTVDIVIKSYPPDYGWLSYCLRSIQKFATGFNQVIVMLPRSMPLALTAETVVLLDAPESYLHQQVAKLNADRHSEADFLLHFDSDMIFTRPITPEYFFRFGKPIWVKTPWSMIGPEVKRAMFHPMAKCLQQSSEFEFMRKGAIIAPRWLYKALRDFIDETHGMSMDAYVISQPGHEFSEYNAMGFFAWLFHREKFHWHDTETDGVPDWPWIQKWSWGGLTKEIRDELEMLLS